MKLNTEPFDFNEIYINLKERKFLIDGEDVGKSSSISITITPEKVWVSMDKWLRSKVMQRKSAPAVTEAPAKSGLNQPYKR